MTIEDRASICRGEVRREMLAGRVATVGWVEEMIERYELPRCVVRQIVADENAAAGPRRKPASPELTPGRSLTAMHVGGWSQGVTF
jgi:hypothetical protein